MADVLNEFLSKLAPRTEEEVAWFGGAMKLQLRVFITTELPPLQYVTSVRAVLFAAGRCAMLSNVDGRHVLPGGRREGQEPIQETLRREMLEETGCTLVAAAALGVLHFRHLTPKPTDYKYPYPDFAQVVFAAEGTAMADFAGDPEHYENDLEFMPPAELAHVDIPAYQRLLVAEAVRRLG